jgi:hypothetical protein
MGRWPTTGSTCRHILVIGETGGYSFLAAPGGPVDEHFLYRETAATEPFVAGAQARIG